MDHGDGVGGVSVSEGVTSPIVSLCESSVFRGGIRVAAADNSPATTLLEFRNQSSKWVAFRLKCTHPSHFTVKPRSVGLIPAKDSQELRLTLQPNYDSRANYHLLIETTFIPSNRVLGHVGKHEVSAIWNEANKNDITTTRFPIFVSNVNDGTPAPKLFVFFDEAPLPNVALPTAQKDDYASQIWKTILDFLRTERFFTNGLVLLLLLCHCVFMYFSCVTVYRTFL